MQCESCFDNAPPQLHDACSLVGGRAARRRRQKRADLLVFEPPES
jgi:hypothetical protein